MGQNSSNQHGILRCTLPLTLTIIPREFEAEVLTGLMPFLLLNQQCQSAEGNCDTLWNGIYVSGWDIARCALGQFSRMPHCLIQK